VSNDGDTKEAGEDGDDDDDPKPRKRVAISRAARGKPPSRKTNPVQLSEDGGAKEVGADGDDDDDDLKPRKRVATSRAARGQQNKDAASAPSRKTGEIAGAKKKPSIEHGSKNNVKTVESHGAGATGNNDHGLVEPSVAVHRVSDHGVARTSSRKKNKPVKYQ
jgi:formamidopyrimidine-DNA glycosylase